MDLRIRHYHLDDKPELIALMEELQDHLVSVDAMGLRRRTPEYGPSFVERLLRDVECHDGRILLATSFANDVAGGAREQVLGCIAGIIPAQSEEDLYEWKPLKTGRVTDLVVRDVHRGAGVGKLLLARLEEDFRKAGCDVVRIEVLSSNAGAVAFYGKAGYGERFRDLIKKL